MHRLITAAAISLGVAAALFAQAVEPPAAPGSAEGLIQLSLGYGFGFPNDASWLVEPPSGPGEIMRGIADDDLLRRIFIRRALTERILLDFDYDSHRAGGLFGEDNVYALSYVGEEGGFLREVTAGNRRLSIEGSPLVPIDEANSFSYALRAAAAAGRFGLEAMLRYSEGLPGHRSFRGQRRVVQVKLPEVSYARWRFFLLPDTGIDEASLAVLRTSAGAGERIVDGKGFDVLVRGTDYDLDDARGWLTLHRSLGAEEELLAYYEKGGAAVGSGLPLGDDAIIDETGARADFDSATYADYFDATATYLYLKRDLDEAIPPGFRGYWEIRSAYLLDDLADGELAERVTVELRLSTTGAPNTAYDALIGGYVVQPAAGALVFAFEDAVGFYPRPFPGLDPYPVGNPFAADNPIYGSLEGPLAAASVNTITVRYEVSSDSFFLDYDIVEGSVTVRVNGVTASPSTYGVDYDSGIITFAPGAVGPGSAIDVTYRYSPVAGGDRELLAAFGTAYELGSLRLHNLVSFRYPLLEGPPVEFGEERPFQFAETLDLHAALGPAADEGLDGPYAQLDAGGSAAVSRASTRRRAVVAAMSAADEAGTAAQGLVNDSPGSLAVQVGTTEHTDIEAGDPDLYDPGVAADPLSGAYREVYEDLHGRPDYRDDQGDVESTLLVSFAPPLLAGETATVSRRFGYPADLSSYTELLLYLYLPAGQSLPSDARVLVSLRSSSVDRLEVLLAPAAFREGWNEILVSLDAPYPVRVNGAGAGALTASGSLGTAEVLRRVGEVRFGLHAAADIAADSVEFWVDEWHLAHSRASLDLAGYARAEAGYRGELGQVGPLPLLSDPALRGTWEHRQGSLLEVGQGARDSWSAEAQTRALGVFALGVEAGGDRRIPGAAQSLPQGFEQGADADRWAHRVALEAGLAFLPEVEHTYERTTSEERTLSIADGDTLLDTARVTRETLGLSERFRFPGGEAEDGAALRLEQQYAYSRSFRYDSSSSIDGGTGLPAGSSLEAALSQTHSAALSLTWGASEVSLSARRDESFEDPTPEAPAAAASSYADKLGSLFSPPDVALPGADRVLRTDRLRFALQAPLERRLGASLGLEGGFGELNVDPATGERDASISALCSAAFPWSLAPNRAVTLTPRLGSGFSGSYAQAAQGVGEGELLLDSLARVFASPFWHLDPRADRSRLREYNAVDLLVASPQVAGTSTARLDSSLSLELGLREPPPYLPGRVGAELKGKTTRQGASYGQERSVVLSAGRTLPLGAGGRVLSLSGSWEQGRDYALKLRKRAAALDSSLRWSGRRAAAGAQAESGTLRANHHLAWRREAQNPADPDLQLVPGRPELEPVVPLRPDKQVLENELLLEYSWQRPARETTLGPPFLRRLGLDAQSQSPGVVRHSERILLDSELVFADRTLLADDVLMPLSVSFEHSSTMEISDALQLELFVKGLGGVEETIEAGQGTYRPALGFELRLTFSLFF